MVIYGSSEERKELRADAGRDVAGENGNVILGTQGVSSGFWTDIEPLDLGRQKRISGQTRFLWSRHATFHFSHLQILPH
jgi:hypothetical protein